MKFASTSFNNSIKKSYNPMCPFLNKKLFKQNISCSYSIHHDLPSKVLELYEGIKMKDRYCLAKAITLVESIRKDHKTQAQQLLSLILDTRHERAKETGDSISTFRIGLSGPPGVGKSTFIERFGMYVLSQGHRVAVLAVDPSSLKTGGSIMGDKTRMPELSQQDNAYIRPSASHGTLGGVARNTNEALILCEAAGYDVCLVETVGVGQSETMVAEMVDMFVLMVPPAGGDEIQGLKKGIVEISDLIVVNKSDGVFASAAREAVTEYTSALKYLHPSSPFWQPRVIKVSAKTNSGLDESWKFMQDYYNIMKSSNELYKRRGKQRKLWMWRQITSELLDRLNSDKEIRNLVDELEQKVFHGEITSGIAADYVVDNFTHKYNVTKTN
ncbi:methylmalonic acidemia type A protein [Rhizophagus irregularis]|nr:methylmalonic acidemia type A protein [Rhizophagus irregularis]PKC69961.1 methylmalonic acidemia type A protein [Rhizophagus irregularis]